MAGRRAFAVASAGLASALLTACATTGSDAPAAPAPSSQTTAPRAGELSLSGRLSVRVDPEPGDDAQTPKAFSGSFEFSGRAEAGQLSLTSPLGSIVAMASWSPGQAELRTGSDRRLYADTTEMARQSLGYALSLPALISWINGQPDPDSPSTPLPAPQAGFEQLGWTVDLAARGEGVIRIRRELPRVVRVQVRLDAPGS